MNSKYEDLSLILEATSPEYNRWLGGGLKAVTGTVKHAVYGQPQSKKGAYGASYATAVGVPLGKFLYTMYSVNKQKCKQSCPDDKCLKRCYSHALDLVIKRIKSDSSALATIKDPAIKARLAAKLQGQMRLYTRKKQNLGQ